MARPLSNEREIRALLRRRTENGGPFWSRADGDLYAPAAFSTTQVLRVLGDLGATLRRYPELRQATELAFALQDDDGGFRRRRGQTQLPCIHAMLLTGLSGIGCGRDPRLVAGYEWLLAEQADDGGWRCPMARLGKSKIHDASNPGTTLHALEAYRHRDFDRGTSRRLARAVEFLLDHWETRKPLGPCFFGIGSRFLRVEYPFLRYNLLGYVHVLSFYPRARRDRRFREAHRTLRERLVDDQVVVEAPHAAWQHTSFARKGEPSPLATARWREIERNLGRS